jgi:hypothetical protein
MEYAARGREGFPGGLTSWLGGRPHLTLAIGSGLVLLLEWFRGSETLDTSAVWPVAQALTAACFLAFVWRSRDSLQLPWVLLLGLGFHLAWVALHLKLGVTGDHDPVDVYPLQGETLLEGGYPSSEYPPGAVGLFALETWLGGGAARTSNALLMIPFQLACVALVWSLRTQWSSWLAAAVALWPLNAYYWEFRFDLVPTAALLAGLVLARRERWYEAGFVLGLGATVKWTPALTFVALLLWLLRTRRFEKGGIHVVGFLLPVALVNLPLLAWRSDELLSAYTTQNERTVTAESFVYLPISLFWDVGPGYWYFGAADVPTDANRAAIWMQLMAVAAVVLLAAVARTHSSAVALAGLAPAVFLLMNRIFSPQFYVLILAAIVVAAALVVSRRAELFAVAGACAVATTANTVLYQSLLGVQPVSTVPGWMAISALSFVPTVLAVAWLVPRAVLQGVDTAPYLDTLRDYRARPLRFPTWIARSVRTLAFATAAVFAAATAFAASVMPYRQWDSLAFGSWSRSIAETGDLWANADALKVSRPLFYVPQGLLWSISDDVWLGRSLSSAFAAALVVCVWFLARRLTDDRPTTALLPPLGVLIVLASSVFATNVVSGMTDVPVAAAAAATGLVLWSNLPARLAVPLTALGACATILAKPSGLLALVGLAAASWVVSGRRAVAGLLGLTAGIAVAIAYDAWQASRLDVSLTSLLRAGNDDFWLARGDAARLDRLAGGDWLGEGARLLIVLGLAHGIARAVGARPRRALQVSTAVALVWSVAGPVVAHGSLGYPLDGSVVGIIGWLGVAAALVTASFVVEDDRVSRRTYSALLVWLAPVAVLWAWQRPDETRLLAPAWPALALLAAAVLTCASLALLRVRPAAAVVPAAALAVVAVANVVAVDGLGRSGWRDLLDLGPSGWRDRAEMENFAYGPFSYELNLARENVDRSSRIVSSDGRLTFFFPGQVDVGYAKTCSALEGVRFFSFLASGESLEFAELQQQPTDPLGWIQCERPSVELVGEHAGIYAAFVVGGPPARAPTPEDCRITGAPGNLLDAVFGRDLSYAEAVALQARALEVGFVGTRIERIGCSTFRVVVTGIPDDATVQEEFAEQAKGVGLPVEYEVAVRYPEVAADISPVAAS